MNKPKIAGTRWETAVVEYLREHGAVNAERRALTGKVDRGDIAGTPGVVHECKAVAAINLAAFADETEIERVNDNADIGLCWIKRKGKGSPANAYVMMSGRDAIKLLVAAGYFPAKSVIA